MWGARLFGGLVRVGLGGWVQCLWQGGALLGFWIGQLLGLDIFAPGYGTGSLVGIALVGLGGGLGLHGARRWQNSRRSQPSKD